MGKKIKISKNGGGEVYFIGNFTCPCLLVIIHTINLVDTGHTETRAAAGPRYRRQGEVGLILPVVFDGIPLGLPNIAELVSKAGQLIDVVGQLDILDRIVWIRLLEARGALSSNNLIFFPTPIF